MRSGFGAGHCPCGGLATGPCGYEAHWEAYVSDEGLGDSGTRNLPASGLDKPTAWQVADELWFKSRFASGGNAYSCSVPNSDGCAAASWFSKMRAVDDDDGNLANGTPHAAALFAAFDRHKIACSAASDPSNQSPTFCPVITAPSLSSTIGNGA